LFKIEKTKRIKMKLIRISAIVTTILLTAFAYLLPDIYTKDTFNSNTLIDSVITDSTKTAYTCPMHPEVIQDQPGRCTKCGMDLVPKRDDSKSQGMNCKDMEKCKEMGCDMEKCKTGAGGCMDGCPMMKMHDMNGHDHDSKDKNEKHEGCKKSGC
jgi:hypothetical protein